MSDPLYEEATAWYPGEAYVDVVDCDEYGPSAWWQRIPGWRLLWSLRYWRRCPR